MKTQLVEVPSTKNIIYRSPRFEKKQLSTFKLDIMALCGFGCRYCSSNNGYFLRTFRTKFADLTEAQTGKRMFPADDPSLQLVYPDVIDKLREQLAGKPKTWGHGHTLVFSMLTDGFSPHQSR